MPARRRTSTSDFGAGARESHDATAFYERFRPPTLSADDYVAPAQPVAEPFVHGDARHMGEVADASVALVVTSPPYFAGKQYEQELERDGVPSSYLRVPRHADRGLRRVRAGAGAGRAHRRQRRQPRAQAVPQPVGRRRPHPRARSRSAPARRADLAEGRGRQRLVRLGIVPQRRQPGVARRHRAGDRRQQGALRPGAHPAPARRRGTATREHRR